MCLFVHLFSSGYVPRPSPLGLLHFLYDVRDFDFIPYYRVSDFITQCDI